MTILSAPWRGFRRWIVGYALLGGWVLALTGATRSAQSPLFAVDNREVLITASATYRDGAGTFGDSAVVTITTNIVNRTIYYSLDGSTPTIGGPLTYTSPITIAATRTIRALAVDGDDFSTKASAPLAVTIVPTYALTVTSPGGGTVTWTPAATVNGSATRYLSGTVVTLTATPATGWTWMNWTGDSTATTSTLSVTMNAARTLQGRFGTTLTTSITGNGTLVLTPATGPYGYGSSVTVAPKPGTGAYFSVWGGAASASLSVVPLNFAVTQLTPTISALFSPLGVGQVTLAVEVIGRGAVTVAPAKNVYAANDVVTVTPIAQTGEGFTGWGGDASGAAVPLSLTLAVSKQVTASFGSQPTIVNQPVSTTVVAGSAVSLAVEAAGLAPLAYQWKKGTATLSGKTAAVLTFSSVQSADAGSYTVVVTNGAGAVTSAVAVLTVTPIVQITSAPANVVIVANDRAQLNVVAAGSGALTYQWYQGASGVTTTPLAGATTATLVTPGLGVTTSYWVRITDAAGNVGDSGAAVVTVSASSPLVVTQVIAGSGYEAGGVVAITNTLTYTGVAPTSVQWATLLPSGWKYLGSGGQEGGVRPTYKSGDLLEWTWTTVGASPLEFSYMVKVPAGTTGDQVIAALVSSQQAGTSYQTLAKPDPLVVKMLSGIYHTADSNRDARIDLLELTRVIELYNYRIGTVRTGAYHLKAGTEDGFAPGPVAPVAMALIPGGTFTMGSVVASIVGTDQSDGLTDATPHAVTLSAFYLAKTETTYADWVAVRTWARDAARGAGVYDFGATVGAGKGDAHPVQTVSWYDVVKWCNATSEREGLTPVYYTNDAQTLVYRTGDVAVTAAQVKWGANGYRLPTEAEWEYAARGGASGQRFPWGDTITHVQANYSSSASYAYDVSTTRGRHPTYATGSEPYTSPVGVFAANGYGLSDMVGNVWEWTWDWQGSYGSGAVTDPRGAASGTRRVLRGGGWDAEANYARSACRSNYFPDFRYFDIGFRPARSSVP
jgi:formylglycine-generating enzyme required for sulfatase activity